MAAVSKKGLTLTKLQTWMELSNGGALSADRLAIAVKEGLEKGEITPQTEEAFAAQSANLLAFAKSLGLIKEKAAAFGGKHKIGWGTLIANQYPEAQAYIAVLKEFSAKTYEVITDTGEKHTIQPLPFYRDITPEAQAPAESTPTEGTVKV